MIVLFTIGVLVDTLVFGVAERKIRKRSASSTPPPRPERPASPSVGVVTDGADHYPQRLEELTSPELCAGERVVAVLPFTTVPKRPPRTPRGRSGRVCGSR